jgi:hypothetical protein
MNEYTRIVLHAVRMPRRKKLSVCGVEMLMEEVISGMS